MYHTDTSPLLFVISVSDSLLCLGFLFGNIKEFLDSSNAAQQVGGLIRQVNGLGTVAFSYLLHHLYILLGQQIVGRIGTATYGIGYLLNSDGLGFSLTDTSRSLTFGIENGLLLGGLSTIDGRSLFTL